MVKVVDLYDEMASLAEAEGGDESLEKLNQQLANTTAITDKIFFDVVIGDGKAERIVFGLYGHSSPRGVRNLVAMAGCSQPDLCYKGSKFHRVIKDFVVQGGDVENGDGTGIANVYGRPFSDDVFGLVLMHNRKGLVQIANSGPNQNGGQFVILTGVAPHLNGNHVIAGVVIEGLDFLMEMNDVEVTSDNSKPVKDVIIKDCGVLEK